MVEKLPIIAGYISTGIFAIGTLPMLVKAIHTRDLASYSLGNIIMSNLGNIIYSLYIFQLPPGPVWFLHIYNLVTTGLMLVWYVKFEGMLGRLICADPHPQSKHFSTDCCPKA